MNPSFINKEGDEVEISRAGRQYFSGTPELRIPDFLYKNLFVYTGVQKLISRQSVMRFAAAEPSNS